MEDTAANQKYRRLSGIALLIGQTALVLPVLVACLWAMELHHTLGLVVFNEQFLALMLACSLVACYVNVRAGPKARVDRVPWYDWLLVLLSLVACGYVVVNYGRLVHELSGLAPERIALGAVAIVVVCE